MTISEEQKKLAPSISGGSAATGTSVESTSSSPGDTGITNIAKAATETTTASQNASGITDTKPTTQTTPSVDVPTVLPEGGAASSPPSLSTDSSMNISGFNSSRTDAIKDMYEAKQENALKELEDAYNKNVSTIQTEKDKIPETYQAQANDLAVQFERNRRNLNQQAAGTGLNTGTATQVDLALNSQWQRDYGGVKQAQADAISDAEKRLSDLAVSHENAIASAIAQNKYEEAAALFNEYKEEYNRYLAAAEQAASFGDFSYFEAIYGKDTADKMFDTWKAQNPDVAWSSGKITAGEYQAITGKKPTGATGWDDTVDKVLESMKKNPYGGGGSGSGGGSPYLDAYYAAIANGVGLGGDTNTTKEFFNAYLNGVR